MGRCAVLGCGEKSVVERTIFDIITNRQYLIGLCDGHAGEYDTYHKDESEGIAVGEE